MASSVSLGKSKSQNVWCTGPEDTRSPSRDATSLCSVRTGPTCYDDSKTYTDVHNLDLPQWETNMGQLKLIGSAGGQKVKKYHRYLQRGWVEVTWADSQHGGRGGSIGYDNRKHSTVRLGTTLRKVWDGHKTAHTDSNMQI
jgi:hypothetical protein